MKLRDECTCACHDNMRFFHVRPCCREPSNDDKLTIGRLNSWISGTGWVTHYGVHQYNSRVVSIFENEAMRQEYIKGHDPERCDVTFELLNHHDKDVIDTLRETAKRVFATAPDRG